MHVLLTVFKQTHSKLLTLTTLGFTRRSATCSSLASVYMGLSVDTGIHELQARRQTLQHWKQPNQGITGTSMWLSTL